MGGGQGRGGLGGRPFEGQAGDLDVQAAEGGQEAAWAGG